MREENKNNTLYKIILVVGSIVILYFSLIISLNYKISREEELNLSDTAILLLEGGQKSPLINFEEFNEREDKLDLLKFAGILFLIGGGVFFLFVESFKKGEYHKIEKGSSKWGRKKERLKYKLNSISDEKKDERNIILSDTEFLPVDTGKIYRNLNITVIGGSGAGKTRYFVKPNLLQHNTNYIITDPKGELHRTTSKFLESKGYKIKTLNLVNPEFSHNYNPFDYVKNEVDISIIVDTIMKNTEDEDKKGGDGFWMKSETALLKALMYYVFYFEEEKTMYKVFDLIVSSKEDDENESQLSEMFNSINQNHIALRFYNIFLQAPTKTRQSILISLAVRMAIFGSNEMENLMYCDNINIDNVEEKTAIYVIISDSNSAYDVISSMFFTQAFQRLYYIADNIYSGSLPIHYQIILDEFANIKQIPNFAKLISTMRGRSISVSIIIQSKAQLEKYYDKDADTILGNCDTTIYLGGNDLKTAEEISKKLGNTTISIKQKSRTKGKQGSSSVSENISERALMLPSELLTLDDQKSIVMIRGITPFYSNRFDLKKHPASSYIDNVKNHIQFKERYSMIEEDINKFEEIEELPNDLFKNIDLSKIDLSEIDFNEKEEEEING